MNEQCSNLPEPSEDVTSSKFLEPEDRNDRTKPHVSIPALPQRHEISRLDSTDSLTNPMLEPPDFAHFRTLIGALMLTTFLAICSAFDAKLKCLSPTNLSWFTLDDDDAILDDGADPVDEYDESTIYEMMEECVATFRLVILPVGSATALFGTAALLVIHRHLSYVSAAAETLVPSPLLALLVLFAPLFAIGCAWTYGIFEIMLRPKLTDGSFEENPFQSLGAVDKMGHVGENANLYYLCWASEILITVLLYLVCVDIFRWLHSGFAPQEVAAHRGAIRPTPSFHDQIHAMLSSTSATKLASFYRQRRKTWYQFMIRLRERSGYWVAAFFFSLLVVASSTYVYIQVLVNLAKEMSEGAPFRLREVCHVVKGNYELPEQYCKRTTFAVLSGTIATCLSITAVIHHLIFRRGNAAYAQNQSCGEMEIALHALPILEPVSSNINLKIEFILSLIPAILLGLNAVFATGVQGPASEVSNLYYASFASFLMVVRIMLGCMEEMSSIETQIERSDSAAPLDVGGRQKESDSQGSNLSGVSIGAFDKRERRSRLRRYLFLAMFSAICAASAWDAADNQDSETTTRQKYLIFAPLFVAILSMILFAMCLNPRSYSLASHILCGGVVSVVCFLVWLLSLLITMHSEDSWAVNGIGEIRMANLYYFSWASIIVSAVQMMSYAEPIVGYKSREYMFVVWAAIVKVCMVILGASLHVWHGVSETCQGTLDEFEDEGDLRFCIRTKFAIVAALVGIVSGWTVLGSRILGCPIPTRFRIQTETCISVMLVLVFSVGVALITGIGGPGQSVGDLFYASWLSFLVSIGIFVACVDQLQQQEMEEQVSRYKVETPNGDYVLEEFNPPSGAGYDLS
jgi:hypothetical protein